MMALGLRERLHRAARWEAAESLPPAYAVLAAAAAAARGVEGGRRGERSTRSPARFWKLFTLAIAP
jgi:hypothetical protein